MSDCAHCHEEIVDCAVYGRDVCECGSGMHGGCCCGWDCMCHHCGSHDHDTDAVRCVDTSDPVQRYAAHSAWLAGIRERRAEVAPRP